MYTIQDVCEKTGLSAHTLRYYEKEGLLTGVERSQGGFRQYSDEDLERLGLICCLKNTGMPLQEIGRFVSLTNEGEHTLRERVELLRRHRENVIVRMAEMQKYLDKVTWKLNFFSEKLQAWEAKQEGSQGLSVRLAREADLPRMLEIYGRARRFMAEHGNPNQWGPTRWPPEALLRSDIAEGHSHVCLDPEGNVIGTFFFIQGPDIEPTYRRITDGAWRDPGPYGVVHRIASDGSRKGIGAFCLEWAYEQCGHLRVDTHGDNTVMQGLLAKLGFVHCGTIHVEEDPYPRLAYEKSPLVLDTGRAEA